MKSIEIRGIIRLHSAFVCQAATLNELTGLVVLTRSHPNLFQILMYDKEML